MTACGFSFRSWTACCSRLSTFLDHSYSASNSFLRLTARLDGVVHRATVSPRSPRGRAVVERGGVKMGEDAMRACVEELLTEKG